MTRCVEFYTHWRTHPNFCGKAPTSARYIDNYVKVLDDLILLGIPEERTIVRLPEGAARPLFSIRDAREREKAIQKLGDRLNPNQGKQQAGPGRGNTKELTERDISMIVEQAAYLVLKEDGKLPEQQKDPEKQEDTSPEPTGAGKKKKKTPPKVPLISEYLAPQLDRCREKKCPELVETPFLIHCKQMDGRMWHRYDCPLDAQETHHPDPEPYTSSRNEGEGFHPAEDTHSAVVHRTGGDPDTYTVHAGKHTAGLITSMIRYGVAADEGDAIRLIFADGEALWFDKIESKIREAIEECGLDE